MHTAIRVAGQFGWVGFLAVCFLHKISPNQRKIVGCGEKWEIPLLT